MEEETTLRFSLRVPKELHERLAASANEHNNSLNAEMLRLLDVGLRREKEKVPDKGLVEQLLPPGMVWRVERFRSSNGLSSNEEAAKRLVKFALEERESTKDILEKLHASFQKERDLRLLAQNVIASHSATTNIKYGKDYVWFETKSDESGAIDKKGKLFFSEHGNEWDSSMDYYTPQPSETIKKSVENAKPYNWQTLKSDPDLDDEIPF
ncbi:toxin-antitoxin system HicB family antitoxin [Acetobacter senegalensis]|uniref:toxin-antitoxin system HicB family antitoxin n=1 Tax=Acetobacter senegalensis TaxID=446692 RepID=UPI00073E91E0|nr:toxin-antitoxin system HicB family antitoxin [Acetobacter senegalensis]